MTEEPDKWIDTAVQGELSVAEMRESIAARHDKISEAEEARRAAEKLTQATKKFNDKFSQVTGQQAVLLFKPVAEKRGA